MTDCAFCDKSKHTGRIVSESENFYAIPTIGQISNGGHMLVISNQHLSCLGSASEAEISEFSKFSDKIIRAVEERYGQTISFEHGIVGQTVPHAHLQILPCLVDMFPILQSKYPFYKKLDSVEELREVYRDRRVYLYYENQNHEKFTFIMDAIPQYLRLVAAEQMGRTPRGDWRAWRSDPVCANLDDKLIAETCKNLKQILKI